MRVMIVEDNYFVADCMRAQLEEAGHTIVGPFSRCSDALQNLASKAAMIDCAVLDVHLDGEVVTAVAEALEALGKPFIFVTGYPLNGDVKNPLSRFNTRIVLSKPYTADTLRGLVQAMADGAQPPMRLVQGGKVAEGEP
jgi:CheY-like chemotaxis protein